MALTSRVRVGLVPYTHGHTKRTHVQVQGPPVWCRPGLRGTCLSRRKGRRPQPDKPGASSWGFPRKRPLEPRRPSTPTPASADTHSPRSSPPGCTSWAASLCTRRSWIAALERERESNRETPLSTRPPGTEFQSVRTVLGRVWGTDVTTTRSRKLGSSRPAGRVEVHVSPPTCPPRGQPGASASSSQ